MKYRHRKWKTLIVGIGACLLFGTSGVYAAEGNVLEAESAEIVGEPNQFASMANNGEFIESKESASGGQSVGFLNVAGNKLVWQYESSADEDTDLTFVLASAALDPQAGTSSDTVINTSNLKFTVNGTEADYDEVTLPAGEGTNADTWQDVTVPIHLTAGENEIALEIVDDTASVNVDCVRIGDAEETTEAAGDKKPSDGAAPTEKTTSTDTTDAASNSSVGMTVGDMTGYIMLAVILLALAIIIFAVVRVIRAKKRDSEEVKAAKKKKKIKRGIFTTLLSLALVIVVVANVAINNFNVVINQFLNGSNVSDEEAVKTATEDSKKITQEIEEEGIVLLENKDDALPLDGEKKVNVFGYASENPTYGGSGSGAGDESRNVTLAQGLKDNGFEVNSDLTEFYKDHTVEKKETNIFSLNGGDYNIYEPATSEYSDELIDSAKEFSDTAILVFARNGGEGGDLPIDMSDYEGGDAGRNYLELQSAEEDLLKMVEDNFENVIVIINSSNAMELGFLEDENVDAALWIGGPGSTGFEAVGKVLNGEVNPSGRLTDTYAYDETSSPAYYNSGDYSYLNSDHEVKGMGGTTTESYKYVDYTEGIYVGYRYYETRWIDNSTGECDEDAYHEAVQYPFGYGLSYTEFTQKIDSFEVKDGIVSVDVKVTNTGDAAGKEVVQVYYTAPYENGGIEKSHVVLGGFGKTQTLEPSKSETVNIKFAVEDMASYDYAGEGCYVLDAGDYEIKLMSNAHDVIEKETYTVDEKVVYDEDNKRSSDEVAAVNHFDDVSNGDGLTYVSRADWEGTLPTERVTEKEAGEGILEAMANTSDVKDNGDEKITTGADNGLSLADLRGKDYDDEDWDALLDQMTIDEMSNLIGYGAYSTQAVSSINKPATTDLDGPAGLNGLTSGVSGVQFTTEPVLAATWNLELAERFGECFGKEANAYGVSGLYAPAMNIHRTPFSGRNFEYYSEDSLLSGKMGSAVVSGASSQGVYCYIKHFALNDQETNRLGVATWCNEQAMREIYLKPFELSVKEGGATAVMSSMNRIGTTWTGASYDLLTTVLRDEWGFEGMVVTDYVAGAPMTDVDNALQAGNDLMLTNMGSVPTEASTGTGTGQQAMRKACHNILYTVVNSSAYENADTSTPAWIFILIAADIVLLALIALGFMKLTGSKKKNKKEIKEDNAEA